MEILVETALAECTVHVACSAGPLPQGLQDSCTGSPAGTRSGQEMGLPCSCQQQPTFGLVSLYSKLTQVLTGGSCPVALRYSECLGRLVAAEEGPPQHGSKAI